MNNRSFKFFALILGLLFVAFVAAAAFMLRNTESLEKHPLSRTESEKNFSSADSIKPALQSIPSEKNQAPAERQNPQMPSVTGQPKTEPDTRQVPRTLTDEQKEENRREIARMAEALPDNMWVPKDPTTGFSPERGERLRKSIELNDKIRKGSASVAEQQEYYTFKLKETTDKIELIRYIAARTEELAAQTGKAYLTRSDMDTGSERIEELEQIAAEFEQKLIDTNPQSTEQP